VNQALVGDDDGLLQLHLGPLVLTGPVLLDDIVIYGEVGPQTSGGQE